MSLTLVSTSTAARILDVSPRTIARKAATGELTKYVVGKTTVRFDRAEVEALARPQVRVGA